MTAFVLKGQKDRVRNGKGHDMTYCKSDKLLTDADRPAIRPNCPDGLAGRRAALVGDDIGEPVDAAADGACSSLLAPLLGPGCDMLARSRVLIEETDGCFWKKEVRRARE